MRNKLFLIMATTLALCGCSSDRVGDSVSVEFPDPECQNASFIELDGSSWAPVGGLPGGWQGLSELDVTITEHSGDTITVEDDEGHRAEFKDTKGGDSITICVNWELPS